MHNYLCMQRISDILAKWPSTTDLAVDLGVKRGLLAVWRHRNRIPPQYWLRLTEAATRRRISDVTLDMLVRTVMLPSNPERDAVRPPKEEAEP